MRRLLLAFVASLALWGHAWAVVDLNSADEAQLRTVKGIGPVKARAILAYRAKNGPFRSVTDLRRVKGFGAKTIARIGPAITLSGKPVANFSASQNAAPQTAVGPRGRH
jgi:competence protein ComEA